MFGPLGHFFPGHPNWEEHPGFTGQGLHQQDDYSGRTQVTLHDLKMCLIKEENLLLSVFMTLKLLYRFPFLYLSSYLLAFIEFSNETEKLFELWIISQNWVQIASLVCSSHMKNAAGECPGQTCSQQQENIWNVQASGGAWVELQDSDIWILTNSPFRKMSGLQCLSGST